MTNYFNFSIILPIYNEAETIKQTIDNLKAYLNEKNLAAEIIAVNDGSTDATKKILAEIEGLKVINHPYNKGYGAAVKTGAANATFDWLLTFDSDGQHQVNDIEKFLAAAAGFDMVVGARQGYRGPLIRQPGKKILHLLAEYLVEKKIPDLNSGLRLINKKLFLKYTHLLPNGFSWTTTITLAFFKENLNVKYIPIEINKRLAGKSQVKAMDAVKTMMVIFRIIMLFSPLRIFLPTSLALFSLALISGIYDIWQSNITDTTILLFLSAILIFFFGLMADQLAAIRREIK